MIAPPNKRRRRRHKKKDAMSIILIGMLVVVLSIVAYFCWVDHRSRYDKDKSTYEIVGLGDSEDDAIGPQYSEEKKAFIEMLNQMMRFQLDMDSIE